MHSLPLQASPVVPLLSMLGLIVARAAGWLDVNDMITRTAFFIPLFIIFLMRLHRQSVSPSSPSSFGLTKMLAWKPLVECGGVSFAIYVVHGPIGQVTTITMTMIITFLTLVPPSLPSSAALLQAPRRRAPLRWRQGPRVLPRVQPHRHRLGTAAAQDHRQQQGRRRGQQGGREENGGVGRLSERRR